MVAWFLIGLNGTPNHGLYSYSSLLLSPLPDFLALADCVQILASLRPLGSLRTIREFVANHRELDYSHVVLSCFPYCASLGVRESIVQAGSNPVWPRLVLVVLAL